MIYGNAGILFAVLVTIAIFLKTRRKLDVSDKRKRFAYDSAIAFSVPAPWLLMIWIIRNDNALFFRISESTSESLASIVFLVGCFVVTLAIYLLAAFTIGWVVYQISRSKNRADET